MKLLAVVISSLIALLQYPLWFGKASWPEVLKMNQIVQVERHTNYELQQINLILGAEVTDLKTGYDAIEERARNELGMIKHDEIFFQVLKNSE